MVYNSLTEIPRNLKEGIDWLVALRGTGDEDNLKAMGTALYRFMLSKPLGKMELPALEKVKRFSKYFLRKPELEGYPFVKEMLKRYNAPMDKNPKKIGNVIKGIEESDYKNVVKARDTKPEAIARNLGKVVDAYEKFLDDIKIPDQYESAYSSEATWGTSCSEDPEACVVVLVGIAPMLYAGVSALQNAGKASSKYGPGSPADERVGVVVKAAGFDEPACRSSVNGSELRKALGSVDKRVLDILYDLAGFWAFY
ncbi:hypothetical protein, conserved [Babesia ovata]|uniref:Uncharacterized protein n=1 Tax=Babesia ovata TaxID=189622 RepID=A0A2H6K6T8_9APIC|nr:uncharacterized protein BOVATA_001930 [Babesia ovata]GBE58700.1 hypothetical protein, conserved [Babesia ovata]